MKQRKHSQGFTLIEVMVVVVILGILAAVIVPKIMDKPDEARINKAKQDIRVLEEALNLYKLDNFSFPTTDQGLDALVQKPSLAPEPKRYKQGGYIKKLPKDPWGNDYQYLNPGVHGEIDVYSKNKDENSIEDDIGNWNLDEITTGHAKN
ncbi:MAG: type II secretion system major pseudopilin GspG [Gammaproteobacteria bacterium]|nr:type II secretion system major pseudopilin GspG [Gammaproteobacteria bacterium]